MLKVFKIQINDKFFAFVNNTVSFMASKDLYQFSHLHLM
jgi:hypothetical protein